MWVLLGCKFHLLSGCQLLGLGFLLRGRGSSDCFQLFGSLHELLEDFILEDCMIELAQVFEVMSAVAICLLRCEGLSFSILLLFRVAVVYL